MLQMTIPVLSPHPLLDLQQLQQTDLNTQNNGDITIHTPQVQP